MRTDNVSATSVNLTQLVRMWISISDLAENIEVLLGFARSWKKIKRERKCD